MCSEAKRNPLFLFRLNALLNEAAMRQKKQRPILSSTPHSEAITGELLWINTNNSISTSFIINILPT